MEYTVDLGIWNLIFAVPAAIVDSYLKSASEIQIKALLYLLRHSGEKIEIQKISEAIGFPPEQTIKAIEHWQSLGLVKTIFSDTTSSETQNTNLLVSSNENTPHRTISKYQKPNSNYIAQRINSSEEISFLVQEAEVIFGRTLSSGDISTLLTLHEHDGLPIDVILMLIQYAVSEGKAGMKYIEKIGINWAEQGIDNLEKAEKKIAQLNLTNILWKRFENIIGIDHRAPTDREKEAVIRWFNQWHFSDELIKEAYDRCVNANGKYILKYMDSIIKRWHTQGIFTAEQAFAENAARKKRSTGKASDTSPSYNIDDYESYNILDYLKN